MTASVTITPMRRRHLGAVIGIETQVFPKPWSTALFEDELDRPGRAYLVARIGPTVVGYAGVLLLADDGHVATVAVDPAQQGRGIAPRLLLELVRAAVALGANQLTLEVRISNTRAHGVYRRFGFAPAGARKAYYGDNGEDALVMWVHDVQAPDYAARLDAIEATFASPTIRQGFEAGPERVAAGAPVAHPALATAEDHP